ncbi:MAG: helix-turn-helix domain-containing protein [Nitrososphaeria archaeon]
MGKYGVSRKRILAVLADGKPRGLRDIVKATGLSHDVVSANLLRCWRDGLLLRTKSPIYKQERVFKGRAGWSRNTRPYHLYVLRPKGINHLEVDGREFVPFKKEFLDARGGGGRSKAKAILDFIRDNSDKAVFSKEIAKALANMGVRISDVMANVRRFEKRGLVYVRGYKLDDRQTPFKNGFLITWIDPNKPREQAIEKAIQRTDARLLQENMDSPLMRRVNQTRDMIIEHSKLGRLLSFTYIMNKLQCSESEAEYAINRALQLYPDLKMIKLFNAYRYYYHNSLSGANLEAAIRMKENYIRMTKGRANRIGHNWEAVVEWFIDKFTVGARFWTQTHRSSNMDPRRITLHLIKSVHGRRNVAEVDRVWEVTPGIFVPPTTYVLSCKWGLIHKEDVDDFLEVLRWSKEFGVNTPDGRQIKQGVVGVFAGGAFDPKENVQLKDGSKISLASYASRMNIQLLKAADFNRKLRERGCINLTVQKICRIAKDENEVREILDKAWKDPVKSDVLIASIAEKNKKLYDFERMLEEKGSTNTMSVRHRENN